MKYLCLICTGAEEVLAEYRAFTAELRGSGHFVAANRLQPPSAAATVRVRHGKLAVIDGPTAETGEHLHGTCVIEARDLNAAIQVAARIPAARRGYVEIRPIAEDFSARLAVGRAVSHDVV